MTAGLPDYTELVRTAVASCWTVRRDQALKSQAAGILNPELRAEVTGGCHLDELQALLVRVFVEPVFTRCT